MNCKEINNTGYTDITASNVAVRFVYVLEITVHIEDRNRQTFSVVNWYFLCICKMLGENFRFFFQDYFLQVIFYMVKLASDFKELIS